MIFKTTNEISVKLGKMTLFRINHHRFLTLSMPGLSIEFSWALPKKILGTFTAVRLLAIINRLDPNGVRFTVRKDGFYSVTDVDNNIFTLPVPPSFSHIADFRRGYIRDIKKKYSYRGFVEVETNDIVVDCGAHIGGFSKAYQSFAKVILAFEPSPRNFSCLLENVNKQSVIVHKCALSNNEEKMKLFLSGNATDDSFLTPDLDATGEFVEVPVVRLDDYILRNYSMSSIDFLKLEAEGYEPEVLLGCSKIKIRKIAADISPERDGKSPVKELMGILGDKYIFKIEPGVLFARLIE
jgi:FkbM family methyltransferase